MKASGGKGFVDESRPLKPVRCVIMQPGESPLLDKFDLRQKGPTESEIRL